MKRVLKCILNLTLILAILISVLNFSSCNRKYDEVEVISASRELLKKSEMINTVLYGKGIATMVSNHQTGAYYEADFLHLRELGFTTIAELEERIRETFTTAYSELAISTVLSPISVDGVAYTNTRYYQLYDDQVNKVDPICIMVFRDYDYVFRDEITYDYDSIRVTGVKKQTLFITVDATVKRSDGESQKREIEFRIIEETDGWRIDSPTYVNYNEYLDIYEDLSNQAKK